MTATEANIPRPLPFGLGVLILLTIRQRQKKLATSYAMRKSVIVSPVTELSTIVLIRKAVLNDVTDFLQRQICNHLTTPPQNRRTAVTPASCALGKRLLHTLST